VAPGPPACRESLGDSRSAVVGGGHPWPPWAGRVGGRTTASPVHPSLGISPLDQTTRRDAKGWRHRAGTAQCSAPLDEQDPGQESLILVNALLDLDDLRLPFGRRAIPTAPTVVLAISLGATHHYGESM
jgi:hypothetical protein